ncbi:glycoside hydrolase family 3 protein [Oidiodendron maius Zn]|uniref:Glycoside hydrolase family 3 protein n=1 Tax=Oidiodendron maius (strain Zn) TaxID=913774 RepID=A0A0C3H574_OIDMZ|nr:glycoside hydrolase family 3 protein [Oidiodendron maius Zn]
MATAILTAIFLWNWWQEGLHGVGGSPGVVFQVSKFGLPNSTYATSFPQPIQMGAAFDDELIFDVATVISIEARAFSKNFNRSGLDFWTPNINPFRDPRWGRGRKAPFLFPLRRIANYFNVAPYVVQSLAPPASPAQGFSAFFQYG